MVIPPPVQLSMAEIIEQSDALASEKEDEVESEAEQTDDSGKIYPELNAENLKKANNVFAEKQKVSIVSLVKLLEPQLSGEVVIITMTKQQEEFIGDIKIEWQSHFRSYFNNRKLILQIHTDEHIETKRQAYTPSEQFHEMLNENNLFRNMVQKFKLKLKQ